MQNDTYLQPNGDFIVGVIEYDVGITKHRFFYPSTVDETGTVLNGQHKLVDILTYKYI